uniref:Uncharacterized protein n=1 Tax=Anguilla anguilla TaxID=7936 RepID=A0A0E9S6H2_ANGAN
MGLLYSHSALFYCPFLFQDFCGHHPRARRDYGPLRLPVSHGHLCQRLHRQLYQVTPLL